MEQVITLTNDSEAIVYLRKRCPRISKVIDMVGDITYTSYTDYYAFLIHSIIEQMLSVKVGIVLFQRFKALCEGHITPSIVSRLSYEDIHNIGLSRHKVSYIQNLTEAIIDGSLELSAFDHQTDDEIIRELIKIKGIGKWTAKMFLIFCLDRPDVLPYEDLTFISSYKWAYNAKKTTPRAISRRLKKWKPYSSIGARYLYKAFDAGFVKQPLLLD